MNEYLKIIIKSFIQIEDDQLVEIIEQFNYKNLLLILILLGFLGGGFYFLNTDLNLCNNIGHLKELNEIGNTLYKLSAELSNSSTVCSWEIIHKVLKDLEKEPFNILKLIGELEKLRQMHLASPGQFSTNSISFEKSLVKLINFLKELL